MKMNINKNYLSRFNKELITVYKKFKQLCESNHLQYFAYGGTCIGAIRHQDIIPWDDDIDILMPRDDYYKFLDLKNQLQDTEFDIVSYRDGGYYFPFTKFINKNTTIWEHSYNPYIIGAFIDVFPLYTTDENIEEILKIESKFRFLYGCAARSRDCFPLSRFLETIKAHKYRKVLGYLKSMLLYSDSDKYLKAFEDFEKNINKLSGDKVVSYCSCRYGFEKEIFQSEWFSGYETVPFADTYIRVPVGYDDYLRFVFGDYMKLPPIEKRVPDHHKYYVNLNEGLTIEEVRQRIKQGETCVY